MLTFAITDERKCFKYMLREHVQEAVQETCGGGGRLCRASVIVLYVC